MVYYYDGAEWVPYGEGIQAILRQAFKDGNPSSDVEESNGKMTVYDLFRMVEFDPLSGKGRLMSWVDKGGLRYIPEKMKDDVFMKVLRLKEFSLPAFPPTTEDELGFIYPFTRALLDDERIEGMKLMGSHVYGDLGSAEYDSFNEEPRYAWFGTSINRLGDACSVEEAYKSIDSSPLMIGLRYPSLCLHLCVPDENGNRALLLCEIKIGKRKLVSEDDDLKFTRGVSTLVSESEDGSEQWYMPSLKKRVKPVALFIFNTEIYVERLVSVVKYIYADWEELEQHEDAKGLYDASLSYAFATTKDKTKLLEMVKIAEKDEGLLKQLGSLFKASSIPPLS